MSTNEDTVPLLGRTTKGFGATTPLQVFGQIATDAANLVGTLVDGRLPVPKAGWFINAPCDEQFRMRRIRSSGQEIVRDLTNGNQPGLPIDDIIKPVQGLNRVPDFHLLVSADTPEGRAQWRMDIGQTLDLACGRLNFQLCGGGPNAFTVNGDNIDTTLGGLAADAVVNASVLDIESADGCHGTVTFSELIRIEGGAPRMIRVPSYAIALKVYIVQGAALTVAGNWLTYSGANEPLLTLPFAAAGLIAFGGNSYSDDQTSMLGEVAYIRTNNEAQDRIIKCVWTIRP